MACTPQLESGSRYVIPILRGATELMGRVSWTFYPSRPGYNQPEDVLTEENVKNGFTARTFVAQTVGPPSYQ